MRLPDPCRCRCCRVDGKVIGEIVASGALPLSIIDVRNSAAVRPFGLLLIGLGCWLGYFSGRWFDGGRFFAFAFGMVGMLVLVGLGFQLCGL